MCIDHRSRHDCLSDAHRAAGLSGLHLQRSLHAADIGNSRRLSASGDACVCYDRGGTCRHPLVVDAVRSPTSFLGLTTGPRAETTSCRLGRNTITRASMISRRQPHRLDRPAISNRTVCCSPQPDPAGLIPWSGACLQTCIIAANNDAHIIPSTWLRARKQRH